MTGVAGLTLKPSPVTRVLRNIPRWVWLALAIIAVLAGAYRYHTHAVSSARAAGYAQGKADEDDRIAKRALELKAKIDGLSARIATRLKERNDEENRAIARDADDLRVRGPGKAACPGPARVAGAAGGHVATGGGADAAAVGLPEPERIAVPFAWVVDQAETCDLNRGEVLAWREWHRQLASEWSRRPR